MGGGGAAMIITLGKDVHGFEMGGFFLFLFDFGDCLIPACMALRYDEQSRGKCA